MQYPDFPELTELVDDDIVLVYQLGTTTLRKIKLSALKAYIGVATPISSNKILTYVSDGDTNGVCYWLGTNEGQGIWNNPHIAGQITCSMSSFFNNNHNNPDRLVNRQIDTEIATANTPNSWFRLEIKNSKKLKCNCYSLRGRDWDGNHPRNWKFQGIKDDNSLIDLDIQINNNLLNRNTWLSLPVTSSEGYKAFQIYFTGPSSSGDNIQTLGEIELYGTLMDANSTVVTPTTEGYSAEANAVISAIEATGVSLIASQKQACNKRIADMKTSGIWAKRLVYYGFLGGTANAHAINWKSPGTNNITWYGNVIHNLSGIQGDGTNGYGDTGLTESLFSGASTHISAYCRASESYRVARDVGNASNDSFQLIIGFEGKSYYRSFDNSTNIESATPPGLTGYFMGLRNAGYAGIYRNGLAYVNTSSSQGNINPSPGNIAVCRAAGNYTSKQFASIGLGSGLFPDEVASDYTSEQAYQTALGRQV